MNPNAHSQLDDWINWLLTLHASEIDLGLERIRNVAEVMDLLNPEPIVITVAGTNGKGSSVAFLSAILQAANYRVATYTSPHIHRFNERININGHFATDQQITTAFDRIEKARGDVKLTYFEFSTLAALEIFKSCSLDVIILEVGLGGRLDAVNIIDADAALITAIDVDHIDWLGDDREQISLEKAGILRSKQLAVCSDTNIPERLKTYANQLGTDIAYLGEDFYVESSDETLDCDWVFRDHNHRFKLPNPALLGDFQKFNAAGAIELICQLVSHGRLSVELKHISLGLKLAHHPGRLEWVTYEKNGCSKKWLFDVAHNPQSSKVLAEYISEHNLEKLNVVFSVLDDKDAAPMVSMMMPYVENWYISDLKIQRSMGEEELSELLVHAGVQKAKIHNFESVAQAARKLWSLDVEPCLVFGSFHTVAQAQKGIEYLVK